MKIPFAIHIPSLVSLRKAAAEQSPSAAPEFLDAVAILAQCAYEDYSDWITTEEPGQMAVNPSTFARTDILGLAAAYLNYSKNNDMPGYQTNSEASMIEHIKALAKRHRFELRDDRHPEELSKIRADLIERMQQYAPMDQVASFADVEMVDEGWDHLVIEFVSGLTLLIPV